MNSLSWSKFFSYFPAILSAFFALCSFAYATLSTGLTTADKATTSTVISSTSWNRIVDGVLELDTRTTSSVKWFGTRVSKSANTNYTAEADGLLWISWNSVYFRVSIDGTNYPYIEANGVPQANGTSETVPIKKWETYSVTLLGGGAPTIVWIPFQ